MTRPAIIRADTIDLQNHQAPSAKEHLRPDADGSLAPHQAETLREVAAETAEERLRSPRISWNNGDVGDLQQHAEDISSGVTASFATQQEAPQSANNAHQNINTMQAGPQQDALAVAQNGGLSTHDADDGDVDDAEVDMDDDMMDKISSSPSIEDGGSILVLPSPNSHHKHDAQCPAPSSGSRSPSSVTGEARSSSPYLHQPGHLPLSRQDQQADAALPTCPVRRHHLPGKYPTKYLAQGLLLSSSHDSITTVYGDNDTEPVLENTSALPAEGMKHHLEEDDWEHRAPRYRPNISGPHRDAPGVFPPRWRRPPSHDSGLNPDYDASAHTIRHEMPPHDADTDQDYDDSGLIVPYESDDEDDDDDDGGDFSTVDDARFLDSGWGGECLQGTEDIDFELVYALHTFVATVDGQANATKGDAMVLLDDANSYWWLVRVVKDSSIGYLPAEHIETPTERLARLNKHRNIDLSATMLGDQAEKSRNPFTSAIKRRKTKTVQFFPGGDQEHFYDPDYSSEEEDLEAEYFARQQQQQGQQTQEATSDQTPADPEAEDETAKVEPLRPRGQQKEAKADSKKRENGGPESTNDVSRSRDSEEIFETKSGDGPKKTSDGTVRDSFFKDDTHETKKITLTPNLLRDDNAPRSSNDSQLKQRPSLDKLGKDDVFSKDDKKKKDRKEKDKKPGGIRGFFSRKDKKAKDEDDESFGKRSMDADVQENQAEEEPQLSPEKPHGLQRNPSKLQKQQPRTEPSPTRKPNSGGGKDNNGLDVQVFLSEGKLNDVSSVPPASMRVVDRDSSEDSSPRERQSNADSASSKAPALDSRPAKTVKAKSRVELDDFDSDEDFDAEPAQQASSGGTVRTGAEKQRSAQGSHSDAGQRGAPAAVQTAKISVSAVNTTPPQQHVDRLSESPVHVSPVSAADPPPLVGDTSSQEEEEEEDHSSARSTPSPELIERDEEEMANNKDSMTTTTSTAAMSWNDVSLRAFFDSGTEIRDMLVVVYDKTDVEPAGPEHPVVGTLFKEPKAALAEITTQLDNMLGDWLARKQRSRGTL